MSENIFPLIKEGVLNVGYPPQLKESVEEAVNAWKDVCSLAKERRKKFPYNSGEGMGVGYELKEEVGASLDIKEDFHYAIASSAWLNDVAWDTGESPYIEFVAKLEPLVHSLVPLVKSLTEEIEVECKLPNFSSEIMKGKDQWFIRFLHYFGGEVGEKLATPHADKSALTLHLYESAPGLEHLTHEKVWQPINFNREETAVIPGMRGQYMSQGKLKATFHRVTALPETASDGRFAVVAFIHPSSIVPQYNKKGAGRLQEFEPGFNYDLSFEDFKKLFI